MRQEFRPTNRLFVLRKLEPIDLGLETCDFDRVFDEMVDVLLIKRGLSLQRLRARLKVHFVGLVLLQGALFTRLARLLLLGTRGVTQALNEFHAVGRLSVKIPSTCLTAKSVRNFTLRLETDTCRRVVRLCQELLSVFWLQICEQLLLSMRRLLWRPLLETMRHLANLDGHICLLSRRQLLQTARRTVSLDLYLLLQRLCHREGVFSDSELRL